MTRAGAQVNAGARKPVSQGVDAYDAKLTAMAWNRLLFREPSPLPYTDDYDDEGDQ
jgi:hypothetical protein